VSDVNEFIKDLAFTAYRTGSYDRLDIKTKDWLRSIGVMSGENLIKAMLYRAWDSLDYASADNLLEKVPK
jgi:hypothetical protein